MFSSVWNLKHSFIKVNVLKLDLATRYKESLYFNQKFIQEKFTPSIHALFLISSNHNKFLIYFLIFERFLEIFHYQLNDIFSNLKQLHLKLAC